MFGLLKAGGLAALLVLLCMARSAYADQRVEARVTVPGLSVSGVPSHGYWQAPAGKRITGFALKHAQFCQVVEVKQIGNSIRVTFHAPPGSIIGKHWGGWDCYALLDVTLE